MPKDMKRLSKITSLILLVWLIYPSCCNAWFWTSETDKRINPKGGLKDTVEEQFKQAMDLYEAEDYKLAISEFNKLVKFYPDSKYAPMAQYYVGRNYEDIEEYYHTVIEELPSSKFQY